MQALVKRRPEPGLGLEEVAVPEIGPNDVLIQDRKVAGILVQLQERFVIAGVGINVNHAEFPPDLADLATSLRLASGHDQSREDLLIALLPAVESFFLNAPFHHYAHIFGS